MPEPVRHLDPVRQYLEAPRPAVLAMVAPDGGPHQAVVHYLLDGDALVVNGRADRRWAATLGHDARVSLVVHDADRSQHWVGIKGSAHLLRTGRPARADAMAMARRYGEDPAVHEGQDRVSFRIVPRRVYEYG